jgi:hypothetical protein
MQVLHHDAFVLELARLRHLQVRAGGQGIQAQHLPKLTPILILLGQPIFPRLDLILEAVFQTLHFLFKIPVQNGRSRFRSRELGAKNNEEGGGQRR